MRIPLRVARQASVGVLLVGSLGLAPLPATAEPIAFKLLSNYSRATFKTDAQLETIVGTTAGPGVTGTVTVDLAKPQGATGVIRIDLTTVNSGVAKRDADMKGPEYLDTANEANRYAVFEVKGVEIAGPLEPGKEISAKVWVRYDAIDYTPLEALGRRVFIREGCTYCHSQYVRPVTGEEFRWGPVSEAGEYAFDLPHLLSTRRIGPDITRVGLKYGDDWHYAHHWDPRLVVPDSLMPSFQWLFHQVRVPVRKEGESLTLVPTPVLTRYFTMNEAKPILLDPNPTGLTFVHPGPDGELPIDGKPQFDLTAYKNHPPVPAFTSVLLLIPTKELVGLVASVQKLGSNRGAWREVFESQNLGVSMMKIPESEDLLVRGKAVFEQRCIGCHGVKGDGNGLAATFLFPRPRDFTFGVFKFHTTPSGSLPTDGDLFRTVTRGVRWTAMPTWHEVSEKDRLAVITYIKTFSDRWKAEKPELPVPIPDPPAATPELLARGKELYKVAKCWQCHGNEGRGDGPSADQLKDDFKFPIRPADFTKGQFKGGSNVADIYRTMTAGLDGTPMPSFVDSMKDDERWAISYYVLSFSAWGDPLTGQKLKLSPDAKAALNSPDVRATSPRLAFDPEKASTAVVQPTASGGAISCECRSKESQDARISDLRRVCRGVPHGTRGLVRLYLGGGERRVSRRGSDQTPDPPAGRGR